MPDVFISHSTADVPTAVAICSHLEGKGAVCWVSSRDIPAGADYPAAIGSAIRASSAMVVVISRFANESKHVPLEVNQGWDLGLRLIPFRVESVITNAAISYFLAGRNCIDAWEPPLQNHLDRLAHDVMALKSPARKESTTFPERPSVAVVPFDDHSADASQSFFSAGLTSDLISRLARLRALPVLGRPLNPAEPPSAAYLVTGRIARVGHDLVIHARLLEVATEREIWAEQFKGKLKQVVSLQGDIAESIAGQLGVEILDRERDRSIRSAGADGDTWVQLLKGDWHLRRLLPQENVVARDHYLAVLEKDPHEAAAHGGLAMTASYDALFGWSPDADASLRAAVTAGEQAVLEDDRDASAHVALATATLLSGETRRALAEAERARELHPAYAIAHYLSGIALAVLGEPAAAVAAVQKAIRLSPNDPWMFEFMNAAAIACLGGGQFEDAASYAQRSIHRRTHYPPPCFLLAASLGLLGREAEAMQAAEEARRLDPHLRYPAAVSRIHSSGRGPLWDRFQEGLRKAGLQL